MTINIETNESLDPSSTTVTINGVKYKSFDSLQLKIVKNQQGELVIQHETGYIEAYKAEVKNEI